MKAAAWIAGLGLALALTACAASAPGHVTPAGDGRIIGTFIRAGGPLGPGGKQPRDRPLAGTVQFFAAHHPTIAVRVGRSGRFAVSLPAGTYRVSGRSPSILEVLASGATRESACSAEQQVAVVTGRTLQISVTCPVP